MSEHFSFPELEKINESIGKFLVKNSHGVIGDLYEIMKPKQIGQGNWYRISCTGHLGLCDYNAGIVCVHFYSSRSWVDDKNITWNPRIYISNLDDGEWEADGKTYNSKEECDNLVDKHANFMNDIAVLPDTNGMNEIIREFGMFGGFF